MLRSVEFTSLELFRKMRPSGATIAISILDQSERRATTRLDLTGFRSAIEMHFEDTAEEFKFAEPGSWPDMPDAIEHARFSQGMGETVPSLRDAQRIHDFVMAHHASGEDLRLVVHCYAGLSRSAAVALWAWQTLGVPLANDRSTALANPRLLRLLAKVAIERFGSRQADGEAPSAGGRHLDRQ